MAKLSLRDTGVCNDCDKFTTSEYSTDKACSYRDYVVLRVRYQSNGIRR